MHKCYHSPVPTPIMAQFLSISQPMAPAPTRKYAWFASASCVSVSGGNLLVGGWGVCRECLAVVIVCIYVDGLCGGLSVRGTHTHINIQTDLHALPKHRNLPIVAAAQGLDFALGQGLLGERLHGVEVEELLDGRELAGTGLFYT